MQRTFTLHAIQILSLYSIFLNKTCHPTLHDSGIWDIETKDEPSPKFCLHHKKARRMAVEMLERSDWKGLLEALGPTQSKISIEVIPACLGLQPMSTWKAQKVNAAQPLWVVCSNVWLKWILFHHLRIMKWLELIDTFKEHLIPNPLLWLEISTVRSWCPGPHPIWPWARARKVHPSHNLLSASPPS